MGTKIISIDPRLTWLGAKAEVWLQVRPGTDGALGIAMLNTIINEDLVDHDFIDKWCYGYEQLVDSVQGKDAEWAAEICDVPAEGHPHGGAPVRQRRIRFHPVGPRLRAAALRAGRDGRGVRPHGRDRQHRQPGRQPAHQVRLRHREALRPGATSRSRARTTPASSRFRPASSPPTSWPAPPPTRCCTRWRRASRSLPQIIWLQSANPLSCSGMGRPAHVRGHQQDPLLRGGRPLHDAHRRGARRHRAARGHELRAQRRAHVVDARAPPFPSAPATTRRSPTSRSSSIWAGA